MATLTYDPTPADQPEFNEAEQEALQVGEEAIAEQQDLLAGKFRDAEELEKAYIELQSKLGGEREVQTTEDEGEQTEPEQEEVEQQDEEQQSEVLTTEDIKALQELAGGADQYAQMVTWAKDNFSEQQIQMYNRTMQKGDPAACYFAVSALLNAFTDANGSEGTMLTGGPANSDLPQFRSQEEVVRAMSDPRYDADPAYRADVFAALERSNLNTY